MSTGTPVVATDVGGVRDWLKDSVNGFLIKPSRPEQIRGSVIKILEDDELNRTMRREARKTAEYFSMDKFADNLLDVIQSTIEQT
jgi:glycosyltransferase involved in cell wall biosynthesis